MGHKVSDHAVESMRKLRTKDAIDATQKSITCGGSVSVATLSLLLEEIDRLRSQMLSCKNCEARIT